MSAHLLLDRKGSVATITLDRPEHHNALTAEMIVGLEQHLAELRADESISVLVIRGAGADFSVGRDDSSLADQLSYPAHRLRQAYDRIRRLNLALATFPAITIAAVRGRALGAGCGMACQCDLVIAADDARFGFPEIDRGLPPTIVMSYLGRVLQRRAAFGLIVTGREVGAAEAVQLGLATQAVAAEAFDATVTATIELLAAKSGFALRRCKEFWTEIRDMSPEEAGRYAISQLAVLMGTDEVSSSVRRSLGDA